MKNNKKQIVESKYSKLFSNRKPQSMGEQSSEVEGEIDEMSKSTKPKSQYEFLYINDETGEMEHVGSSPVVWLKDEKNHGFRHIGFLVEGHTVLYVPIGEWENFQANNQELIDRVENYYEDKGYEVSWASMKKKTKHYPIPGDSPPKVDLTTVRGGEQKSFERETAEGEPTTIARELKPPTWKLFGDDFFLRPESKEKGDFRKIPGEVNQHLSNLNLPNLYLGGAIVDYENFSNRAEKAARNWSNDEIPIYAEAITTFEDPQEYLARLKAIRRHQEVRPLYSKNLRYRKNWEIDRSIAQTQKEKTEKLKLMGRGYNDEHHTLMTYINFDLDGKRSDDGSQWVWTLKSQIKYGRANEDGTTLGDLITVKEIDKQTVAELDPGQTFDKYNLVINVPSVATSLVQILDEFKQEIMSITPGDMAEIGAKIAPHMYTINESKDKVYSKKLIETIIKKQKSGISKTPKK